MTSEYGYYGSTSSEEGWSFAYPMPIPCLANIIDTVSH